MIIKFSAHWNTCTEPKNPAIPHEYFQEYILKVYFGCVSLISHKYLK